MLPEEISNAVWVYRQALYEYQQNTSRNYHTQKRVARQLEDATRRVIELCVKYQEKANG